MAKYLVETYYTCTFKVNHYLDDINEAELKNLEKRDDGKFEVLDVKLDNRKTKSLDPKNNKVLENNKVEVVTEKDNNKSFTVDKNTLLGSIRRVSIFSNKSTHQVALTLTKEDSFITTEDPEKSSKAKESIVGQYEGEDITIGYNAEYLKDVVGHVSSELINIKLNNSVSAALFEETPERENVKSLMLLMPIRLND